MLTLLHQERYDKAIKAPESGVEFFGNKAM